MGREIIFVNSTGDTFTPTASGAIASWLWEMCRAATNVTGKEPWVLTKGASVDEYPWPRRVSLNYPNPPPIRGFGRIWRSWAKFKGWAHVCEGTWVQRLRETVTKMGWEEGIFVFHNDPELLTALRPYLPKARLFHLFHNCNRSQEPWRSMFAQSIDAAFAVSQACARWNETYFGCAIQVLRNGVDSQRFTPIERADSAPPVLGFAGRTDRQKAPDLLLRAALKLCEKGEQFSLQLIGSKYYGSHEEDAYQDLLNRLCQRLSDSGTCVERPGFVSRYAMPRVLAKADIHVVPSRWEDPCPLTVLEGMAVGQVVVGAGCGGIPELIGGDGFLFERDDVDGLTSLLGALLRNKELRETYSRRSRERAERRPWETVFLEFQEAIGV